MVILFWMNKQLLPRCTKIPHRKQYKAFLVLQIARFLLMPNFTNKCQTRKETLEGLSFLQIRPKYTSSEKSGFIKRQMLLWLLYIASPMIRIYQSFENLCKGHICDTWDTPTAVASRPGESPASRILSFQSHFMDLQKWSFVKLKGIVYKDRLTG